MKRKICYFLLLLLAVLAGAGIYFLPSIRGAAFLQKHLETERFTYRLEVRLDREKLPEEQRKLLDALADMTGLERGAVYDLTLEGTAAGDILYVLMYPAGCGEPLLELYLGEDDDVVNGALLYNAVRNRYTRENRLLDAVFPVWENHAYVSLEQVEQLFDVDLSGIREFERKPAGERLSFPKTFLALALMSEEKNGSDAVFAKRLEGAEAELILHDTAEPFVEMKLSAVQPYEMSEKLQSLFGGLEIAPDDDLLRATDEIAVEICFGQGEEPELPEDLVSRETIDAVVSLKTILNEIKNRIN